MVDDSFHSINVFTRTFNPYISHQLHRLKPHFPSTTSFTNASNNERRSNENLWIINFPDIGFQDEAIKIFKNLPIRYDSLVFEFKAVTKGKQNNNEILHFI